MTTPKIDLYREWINMMYGSWEIREPAPLDGLGCPFSAWRNYRPRGYWGNDQ